MYTRLLGTGEYTLQILWKYISFEYLQMIVKPHFADFAGIEFGKKMIQSSVQV